ncbi:uncharacterized protein LOC130441734 [Diorhabda sublineata]|uniref:uncharacterized protein LOC130441734 n=1 Tax=Diorhabda sublineata TaxID=1163346 RepID=UPI0024E15E90|nr:uncharacterized protein LOC130441734 [Diorhabda sublineata]
MDCKLVVFGLFFMVSGLAGDRENVTVVESNQGRSIRDSIYRGLLVCALRYDAGCFMDVAHNYLDLKRTELLAQADQEVARATGSTSAQAKPSQIAKTIEKLFADLTALFKDGFSSWFNSKDDDDEVSNDKTKEIEGDDDEEDDDDNKKGGNASRDVGVIFLKVALLVKIFEAVLKLKLVLLGTGFLILYVVKIWLDHKNRKDDHMETGGIVYKNPLEAGGAEWAGPGTPGEYHGRSSVDDAYAQRLAYRQHLE